MFNEQPPGNYMPCFSTRAGSINPTMQAGTGANGGCQDEPSPAMMDMGIKATLEQQYGVCETESNTIGCVHGYHNHQKYIILFWKDHYPKYYNEVVFNLSM